MVAPIRVRPRLTRLPLHREVAVSLFQAFTRFKRSFTERRRSVRVAVQLPAWIDIGDGSQLLDATVLDISEDGARIMTSSSIQLPKKFWLVLNKDKTKRRFCRTVFRSGTQAGLQFLSANQSDLAPPTLN